MKLSPSAQKLLDLIREAGGSMCCVDGCKATPVARGYCSMHYQRLMRHGDPSTTLRPANGALLKWILEVAMHHEEEECLLWPFNKDRHGYGNLAVDGRRHKGAHRHVCELANGPPPTPEHEAAHSCGNGKHGCVSPRHLSWKSAAENQADRLDHGTSNRGGQHPSSKLCEWQVRFIRSSRGVISSNDLAAQFDVTSSTIRQIQRGTRWSWLKEGADAQTVTPEVHRIIRQLARKGLLHVEQVDAGYRYSLREGEDG